MASALSRVLRWREQLLSKSGEKHRAQKYKQTVKEALGGLKADVIGELSYDKLFEMPEEKTSSHIGSSIHELGIENVMLSGSVGETTEVHVCKPRLDQKLFLRGHWLSGDERRAMPHWGYRTEKDESSDIDEQSDAELFEQASDIDFMLQLGPVVVHNGALLSTSNLPPCDSDLLKSDSNSPRMGLEPLLEFTPALRASSKRCRSNAGCQTNTTQVQSRDKWSHKSGGVSRVSPRTGS